jgi:DNA-binding beta-propeller fold protein YncE
VVLDGGIAVDLHNNIIAADPGSNTVDIIDPPYTKVTKTIGPAFFDPLRVTLSKNNKLLLVGERNGKVVTTLGEAEGVSEPFGAAEGPDTTY